MKTHAVCALAGALLFAAPISAQEVEVVPPTAPALVDAELPPLLDREVFFGDPEIAGAELSPDGRFIAFRKPYEGVLNIWVKGVEEPFDAARPITADDRPVPGYFWSEDGTYVLYVQDKGGNEDFHVYAVRPSEAVGGTIPEARDLTPVEGVRAVIYSTPENTPGEIIVGLNDRDAAYHDVYRVNLESGERELLIENTEQVGGFLYDDEGTVRFAFKQKPGGGLDIYEVDSGAGTLGEIVYSCDYTESCGPVGFHADNERLYFQTNKGDRDLTELVLFDPATGKETLIEGDPEGQVDFGGALFSEDDELLATVYVGDRVRIYPKDERFARDLANLREQLPEGELGLLSRTKDERFWLFSSRSDVDPGSVYLYDRETGEAELVYRGRPDFPSEHMAPMRAIRYTARDGREIPAYLTVPKGVEARNLPLVLHPHGGPWARDNWGYSPYAQFLANRGYAVLQPNFRSSTGYGKDHLNSGNKEWGTGAMQHDLTDGVQYLIDEGIADPERIGIFGGSYGGYATLAGVTFTPDLYAAAVPYVAPSSLITLIESFPAYWRPFLETSWYRRVGDPADEEDRADLDARSPLNYVDRIVTPLLVVHGANDPRVKQRESDQLVVALRDRDIDVDYIVAADEGHGFRGEMNRLALAAAMERFLAGHLGGRYQADVRPEIQEQLDAITVDPATVTLAERTADAGPAAELPFDGAKLEPMTVRYSNAMTVMGNVITMKTESTLVAEEAEGEATWKLVDSVHGPMNATDTNWASHATLAGIRRTVESPQAQLSYRYEDGVHGEVVQAGQTIPVDVAFDGPIVGDGMFLFLGLGTLPLEVGYATRYNGFDQASMSVLTYEVEVTGMETVEVPAGTFETYVVETARADGEAGGATVYISATAPHVPVKVVYALPAQMGGGTGTMMLEGMDAGEGVETE
ncbi:MAG TPA: alpha/beta fold hydrolase [Longimicrobiales bacterium]|nr:alpha/beta fold hydrolase [Longimicrobiales bacterium]